MYVKGLYELIKKIPGRQRTHSYMTNEEMTLKLNWKTV